MSSSTATRVRQKRKLKRQRRGVVLIGALLIAILGGWVLFNTLRTVQEPSVTQLQTIGTELGEIAPDFSVPTLDGGNFTLSAQKGKPTIIFYMAYWCGTCIPEARALAQLKNEYGDRISIVAIDVDPSSTPPALAQFKQASGDGDFYWAFDTGQEVLRTYQVRSLDTTYILDAEGHILYKDEFPTTYETLKDALQQADL